MTARDLIRELSHAKLELQDDRVLEQFRFSDGTFVTATLGTKNGAVCGPVLTYRITEDDAVEISSSGALLYRWERAHVSGDKLTVFCEGLPKTFSITRVPRKERWLP